MSRNGLQGFQAERLRQVLRVRMLTQLQLATLANVSKATISKWYNGKQFPSLETIEKLSDLLNVRPEIFLTEYKTGLGKACFRGNASALKRGREMLQGRLEWAEEVAEQLQDYLDFPEVNIPQLRFSNPAEITDDDIEEAAAQCRSMWKLGKGPIQDLALAAEGAGIILLREETGIAAIEGLSSWSSRLERPLVFLSSDKANGYRSRFDLAHEIGHLCLHRHVSAEMQDECYATGEEQAHKFAGALLLPAESIAREVSICPTWDELLLLKKKWGVSAAAILMRLKALEIVSEDRVRQLFRQRSVRWGRRAEPGDGALAPERPRLLRRSIELLVRENVMPLSGIQKAFGFGVNDLEGMLGLEEGYLSRGEQASNIVELASLRRATEKTGTSLAKSEDNVVKVTFGKK